MKKLLLTFDLEEFDIKENKTVLSDEEKKRVSYTGLKRILLILDKKGVKSTFFTTLFFSECYPELLKELVKHGHEIALHGYRDKDDYRLMSENKVYSRLKESKEKLEGILGVTIKGFRAPRLRPPPYEVLKRIGVQYDSSFHPTYLPGRYNNFFGCREVFSRDGLNVVPISVTPVLRLPFSWLWFRNLGIKYAKVCTNLTLVDQDYVNIYFHPWEFVSLEEYQVPQIMSRNTGEKLGVMLGEYVLWCLRKKMEAVTVQDYINYYSV